MAPHKRVKTMRTSAMESIFELVLHNFLQISVEDSGINFILLSTIPLSHYYIF